jgi:hypothetical protein
MLNAVAARLEHEFGDRIHCREHEHSRHDQDDAAQSAAMMLGLGGRH